MSEDDSINPSWLQNNNKVNWCEFPKINTKWLLVNMGAGPFPRTYLQLSEDAPSHGVDRGERKLGMLWMPPDIMSCYITLSGKGCQWPLTHFFHQPDISTQFH
ncbi:MAG: hypothetical protein LUQ38_04025, partial [Methanotrichaceae archaeon]|nr:hypothetical protein [Methanotrichaceae archaeon]